MRHDGLAMKERLRSEDSLEARLLAEIPYLRAFLRRLMGGLAHAADGEDVLQEVMSRALRYRDAFDRRRALRPWLRTTALREWLDHRERRRREPVALGERESELHAPVADEAGSAASVESLLRPLSAIERDVLVRFHRDDCSVREIAETLGMPEGTVKSHLHRARRRLAALGRREEVS